MISYQVIKQGLTKLHLNSDYLRLVYSDYIGREQAAEGPYIIVKGFIAGRDIPVPLTAINEYDFSIVKDEINKPGNYLFSTAGFSVVQIEFFSPEINSMDGNERSSSYSQRNRGIEVSWEEK